VIALARIAWRNLWRHARRSLITAAAMAVGVAFCMAMLAITDGMYAKMFEVMVEQSLGHVQVHDPAFPGKRSMYATMKGADETLARLDALPGTAAATGRLLGFGLLGGERKSTGGQLLGVIPAREAATTPVARRVVAGSWLGEAPAAEIVLGDGIANDLGLGVGDEVVVVTQASDGSLGNALYTIRGIVRTGSVAIDDGSGFVHLDDLRALLVLPDQLHEITLLARDDGAIAAYQAELKAAVGDAALVRTWWEVSPQTQQLFGMQSISKVILLGLVFTVAGFGVVNTMLMSVFERTRELGVLKAIGMRPGRMVVLVLLESLMLAGVSVVLGLALGGFLDWWLVTRGLDFTASMKDGMSMGGVTLDPVIRGQVQPAGIAATAGSVFVVAALAALWPALRAARLQPVEAIRTE
jgi:ABC-type lipoprotein release transport system permease subunit